MPPITPVKLLLVEDNEADALLLVRQLEQCGYAVHCHRVDTAAGMNLALDQQGWDLVICDYSMPQFSAPEALTLLQERQLDLPFILVSGTVGEDIAVEAMRQGADDYLLKDRLDRLSLAVERVLAEKRFREEQRRSEDRIREQAALLDQTQDAIWVQGPTGTILYWNRGAERLYGWSAGETVGNPAENFMFREVPTRLQRLREALLTTINWTGELELVTRAGQEVVLQSRWVRVPLHQGIQNAVLVVDTDVTQHKRVEALFLRAQRMESVGHLAGGIAHDLNNVLAPIMMSAMLLRRDNMTEEERSLLDTLEASAKRGAEIVRQVLTFARGAEGKRSVVQPRYVLKEVIKLIRETFPKNITLTAELPPTLPVLTADPTQLFQVLLNLSVNARDAMSDGGILTLRAEAVDIDEGFARMDPNARTGHYLLITVADSGVGIPTEMLDKIFDPFFTTKGPDLGTGLGLSTVLGIIKGHGGFVHVDSQVRRGSRFRVYLPAFPIGTSPGVVHETVTLQRGTGQTILVVDDEESIRNITRKALERHGYRVFLASDGTQAVATFAQHPDAIDLVITDLAMPQIDGRATARVLRTMKPGIRILAMSGQAVAQESGQNEWQSLLPKPFTAKALLREVHRLLNSNLPISPATRADLPA